MEATPAVHLCTILHPSEPPLAVKVAEVAALEQISVKRKRPY
jgi:hypothetical protein